MALYLKSKQHRICIAMLTDYLRQYRNKKHTLTVELFKLLLRRENAQMGWLDNLT